METNTPPAASLHEEEFLIGIRRRKAVDLAFAITGIGFVAGSLAVLLLLFGQLIRDGRHRLFSGHLVTMEGFAPSIRDLVGELRLRQSDANGLWELQRDTYAIVNAAELSSEPERLAWQGQHVVVSGDLPAPGQREMQATAIQPTDDAAPTRFSREEVHGKLVRLGDTWAVEPTPLPVDLSELEAAGTRPTEGRFALRIGLSKSLPLKARSLEPLVFQSFFSSMPSREAERAGIKPAIVGSILVVLVTMAFAVPLGIAAGVWLEEYGRKSWFTALIEINIANLAGVPSIVWGLMSLSILVYHFGLGRSIQTAGITLGLLVLPIVIMSTREAIRAIPNHIREASYACGASKWQTVRYHILPYATGGILTGSIIGLSRAIGETAPLITIGALTYVAFLPEYSWTNPLGWLRSEFTTVPIQMFNWISRPDKAFHENAAAAGIILLVLTLSMNAVAIVLRYRLRKRIQW